MSPWNYFKKKLLGGMMVDEKGGDASRISRKQIVFLSSCFDKSNVNCQNVHPDCKDVITDFKAKKGGISPPHLILGRE